MKPRLLRQRQPVRRAADRGPGILRLPLRPVFLLARLARYPELHVNQPPKTGLFVFSLRSAPLIPVPLLRHFIGYASLEGAIQGLVIKAGSL